MRGFRRRRFYIDRSIQKRVILLSLACVVYTIALSAFMNNLGMRKVAESILIHGGNHEAKIEATLIENSLILAAVLLPSLLVLFTLCTFRIAGPLFRFRHFLEAVSRGEHPDPCRIRDSDKLQDVCELLNKVTAAERARQAAPRSEVEPEDQELVHS